MLVTLRERLHQMMRKGMGTEDMLAAGATKEFDARCGDPALFLSITYRGMWLHVRELGGNQCEASLTCWSVRGLSIVAAVGVARPTSRRVSAHRRRPRSRPAPLAPRALLDTYCVTCHNQRTKTAGLTFDTMDLAKLPEHADVWEKTVRKLRGGMMPPPGVRRPDQASVDSMVSWLERSLDEAAAAHPESRPRRAASAQSRRVRRRHRGSAGAEDRRRRAASQGR